MVLPTHHFSHIWIPAWPASNGTSAGHQQRSSLLFFALREKTYFLGGSRGWTDGLFAFSDNRWVRKRGPFQLNGKHRNTQLAPEERSHFGGLSMPWREVNHSKSKRQGQACRGPPPAPSGCPSLPARWERLCSAVEGRVLNSAPDQREERRE